MSLLASVLIPTWRRKELLHRLILSLEEQTLPRDWYEILVCDSGSKDGTAEMVAELSLIFNNIRFVDISANTPAAKRNQAFDLSNAPIAILLDDDLEVCPEFVEAHIDAFRGRSNVVFCGSVRFPPPWVSRSNYYRYRDSRHIGPGRPDIDPNNIPPNCFVTMNFSCRKAELETVGFMDETFTKYGCEDVEFGYRVKKAGLAVEFLAKALAYHHEGGGDPKTLLHHERKHYTAARYGVPLLLSMAPGALERTKSLFLEPIREDDSWRTTIIKVILRLMINRLGAFIVRRYLVWTDSFAAFYAPPLYRYLLAYVILRGCQERQVDDLKAGQVQEWLSGWEVETL